MSINNISANGKVNINQSRRNGMFSNTSVSVGRQNQKASPAGNETRKDTGRSATTGRTLPPRVTPELTGIFLEMSKLAKAHMQKQNEVGFTFNDSEWDASGNLEFRETDMRIDMSSESLLSSIRFRSDTIQELISDSFSDGMGRAAANVVAIEIGYLIKSAAASNGTYIEERAVNRELGLRLAEHFAKTHIDNKDEINTFMETLRGFAERDEMLDKGYIFENGEPHPHYLPRPNETLHQWNSLFSEEEQERMANEFADNVKMVTEIISNSRGTVRNRDVRNLLAQINSELDKISNQIDEDSQLSTLQWIKNLGRKQGATS